MRADANAVEGLPLQLMIMAIVVAVSVPPIFAGLAASERQHLEMRVREEAYRVIGAAQSFYIAGGGSEVLEIDLTGLLTVSVEYVRFGGNGGNATVAFYRLTGDPERAIVPRPAVPMSGADGRPFVLGAGLHHVRVELVDESVRLSAG